MNNRDKIFSPTYKGRSRPGFWDSTLAAVAVARALRETSVLVVTPQKTREIAEQVRQNARTQANKMKGYVAVDEVAFPPEIVAKLQQHIAKHPARRPGVSYRIRNEEFLKTMPYDLTPRQMAVAEQGIKGTRVLGRRNRQLLPHEIQSLKG